MNPRSIWPFVRPSRPRFLRMSGTIGATSLNHDESRYNAGRFLEIRKPHSSGNLEAGWKGGEFSAPHPTYTPQ
jgi:hypothetical protein